MFHRILSSLGCLLPCSCSPCKDQWDWMLSHHQQNESRGGGCNGIPDFCWDRASAFFSACTIFMLILSDLAWWGMLFSDVEEERWSASTWDEQLLVYLLWSDIFSITITNYKWSSSNRFDDMWEKHREPQKVWGLLCMRHLWQLIISTLETKGLFSAWVFISALLRFIWVICCSLPSNRVHVPCIPPLCVSTAPVRYLPSRLLTANSGYNLLPHALSGTNNLFLLDFG